MLPADKFFLKVDELRVTGNLNDPVHHDALIVEHLQRNMNAMLVLSVSSAFEAKKRSRIETLDTFRELGVISPDDYAVHRLRAEAAISYETFKEFTLQNDPHVRRYMPSNARNHKDDSARSTRAFSYTPATTAAPASTPVATETTHASPVGTPARGPDVVPMDIDRTKHKRFSPTACYTCGEEGHKSWGCPKNPQRFNARELSEREESIIRRVLQEKDERKAAEAEAKEDDEEDKEEEDF